VRSYEQKTIPSEILSRVLEAGRAAPSASNNQPWHFIVVRDQEKRKILSNRMFTRFLAESPVVIVGCGEKNRRYHVVDVSIAMQQMVIAATSEGLGTCWIGDFNEETVRTMLKIPEKYNIICLLAMGYPKEKTDLAATLLRIRGRKKLENIVSFDEYGKHEKLLS